MGFRDRKPLFFIVALIIFSVTCACGQTQPEKNVPDSANQITADKNFELNIPEDRIVESDFKRSTNVELTSANRGGLRVEVGVGVRAESIVVTLRGIFGHVRFRASLESLRQKIEQLQNPSIQKQISPSP